MSFVISILHLYEIVEYLPVALLLVVNSANYHNRACADYTECIQSRYAYGIKLLSAERVADEVMKLNVQLAQTVRENGVTFTLDDLNQRFQALLRHLEDAGICRRDVDCPPIITKEHWLHAQLATIQKPAKGEKPWL